LHPTGTVCDPGRLEEHAGAVVNSLHYRDLDEVPPFHGGTSTVERVAEYIARQLAQRLAKEELLAVFVRVWESERVFAGVRLPIGA
jgi:hypothetical protein